MYLRINMYLTSSKTPSNMKKLLFIVAFLFLFQFGNSQTYRPMVKDSMMDFILRVDTDSYPPYSYKTRIRKYVGDTVIDGKTYVSMYEINLLSLDTTYSVDTLFRGDKYVGGIRENNKKVFFYSRNDTTERLVYDFNLNVGDTMEFYYGDFSQTLRKVKAKLILIDSLWTSNFPLNTKRYRYTILSGSFAPGFDVVEGYGKLHYWNDPIIRTTSIDLTCLIHGDSIIFKTYMESSCFQGMLASLEKINKISQIKLFPNPSKNKITIESSDNKQLKQVLFYSLSGKLIKKVNLIPSVSNRNISVKELPKGFYFVKIIGENKDVTLKFIKE